MMRRTAHTLRASGVPGLLCILAGCDPGAGADDLATAGGIPAEVARQVAVRPASPALAGLDGAARMATLGCGACHAGVGSAPTATALAEGAGPRDPAALFAYLTDSLPSTPRADGARMPDFQLTQAEALALALYLGQGRAAGDARAAFRRARDTDPEVASEDGARVYAALRCGTCHGGLESRPAPDAPALAMEGARVSEAWLRAFLRKPHAVRPFGASPGSGARMPDFGLHDDDVDAIVTTLLRGDRALPTFEPDEPSAFSARKVETLLRERYDCLGCHSWNGEGGRIAPDLARASARLRPAYIRAMLDDPARLAPGTMMPRSRLPSAQLDVLAGFLATYTSAGLIETAYLSAIDHAPLPPAAGSSGEAIYLRRCAACHGAGGQGDGFNAPYLDVAPAAHADAEAMRRRPDDTLHDGIAGGGRILGRSARMPAFGASLSPDEIQMLVAYIRSLCACAPPSWSADGGR